MYRSPNSDIRKFKDKSILPYKKGNNQIFRTYSKAIDVLLTKEYYEGSEFGQYYNQLIKDEESNDVSAIYVKQPEIEKVIKEQIINTDLDMVKYLVGYEGVGKTTLIRNMFHVFNRKTSTFNNNLVIYISFYSSRSDSKKDPEKAAREIVVSAIEMAITFLSGYDDVVDRVTSYDEDFYKKFAKYLSENNQNFAHNTIGKPSDNLLLKKSDNPYIEYLNRLYESNTLDYNLTLLKYYLSMAENRKYRNVYFIFDDLETLPMDFIDEIFYLSMHLDKCAKGLVNRKFKLKQLLVLRSYTFRQSKYIKQFGANKISNNDIIIKNQIPSLTQILKKRLNCIEKTSRSFKQDNGIDAGTEVKIYGLWEDLNYILNGTYAHFDRLLLNLTQYNLFNSLQLLIRIVSNQKFIGKKEIEKNGIFEFNVDNYDFENRDMNSSIPGNSDVFYALAYGDNDLYFDSNDYYLTNIMHYHVEDKQDTELFGLYIIQYMIQNKVSLLPGENERERREKTVTILPFDDCNVIEGDSLINNIAAFYNLADRTEFMIIKEGLKAMLEHLYNGGALLQDIRKPILDDGQPCGRKYEHGKGVRVYLSLRGFQLYKMLEYNSLLYEVYRDDIDADLVNNNIPTQKMSVFSRIKYCISYTEVLFAREQKLFSLVGNKTEYFENFGDKIATIILLSGIKQSIVKYFTNETEERKSLIQSFNIFSKKVNEYIDEINRSYHANYEKIGLI